ncbi:TonB-dependent receptor [Steroidobacter sp.]|uniref:TonB-dependent receptor n=1 Tax=Steroidobacter sp. TaxID=1978227 RepID=UPI001A6323BD|nr:TonB-dependent receptor [Steroidobacter sp.]MBL8265103.1 TonB-dependent receptor [Steroidobacter sp.]
MRRSIIATSILLLAEAALAADPMKAIAPKGLTEALTEFASQSGLQVVYRAELTERLRSRGSQEGLSAEESLQQLLRDTGLRYEFVNDRTVAIRAEGSVPVSHKSVGTGEIRLAQSSQVSMQTSSESTSVGEISEELASKGIPEVLVQGKRSLNVDIERTEDDPQPYVIFDRGTIERSGATSLNDFLATRLPMNASGITPMAADNSNGNVSTINLRGLGAGQTLILIDGRRAAKTTRGFDSGQTDINGIPLAAIERIEVLPTTASAIYGGAATGGVVNIVMRRDYNGTQASLTYDNSFEGDSAVKRIDLSSGFTLFEGKTSVLLTGSYTESNVLRAGERDFLERGRRKLLANNPGYNLPLGNGNNIRSASGDDLVLDDGRALNSFFTSAPAGYGGFGTDGGAALLANAGTYDISTNSRSTERNSSGASGGGATMSGGGPAVKYIGGSIRHEFSDRIKGFLEMSRSENRSRIGGLGVNLPSLRIDADAPSNPFQQDINVSWATRQLSGGVETDSGYKRYGGGLIVQLPHQWTTSVDYTLSQSDWSFTNSMPFFGSGASLLSAISDGSIDVLRDIDAQGVNLSQYLVNNFTQRQTPLEVTTKNPAIRISGPLGSLPAGSPQLSVLLERQDSDFGASTVSAGNGFRRFFPERSQKVDSAYLELRIPLVSKQSKLSWLDDVELQLAGRWDKYQSVNASAVGCIPYPCTPAPFDFTRNQEEEISPLTAIRVQLNETVAFRASYSTGFLPPDIGQLTAPTAYPDYDLSYVLDPRRGNTPVTDLVEATYGGNPELSPETSTTWSAGIILTPVWAKRLRLSADYTRIKKKDNITSLSEDELLANEAYFPGRVTRGPKQPGDPVDWAGPIIAIDASSINAARSEVEAFDFQVDYSLPTASLGSFSFFAIATWQTQLDEQTSAAAPMHETLGWSSGLDTPLKLRGNVGVEWSTAGWALGWNTRYLSSYYVADPTSTASENIFLAQGNDGRVPSQIYHDVFAKYGFSAGGSNKRGFVSGLLNGLQVQAGVRNLFNTSPPYDVSSRYYYYSGLGDPRLATYYLTIRQSF